MEATQYMYATWNVRCKGLVLLCAQPCLQQMYKIKLLAAPALQFLPHVTFWSACRFSRRTCTFTSKFDGIISLKLKIVGPGPSHP